jgi:hypothetical protein
MCFINGTEIKKKPGAKPGKKKGRVERRRALNQQSVATAMVGASL